MNGTREEPDGGKEAPRASEKGLWILLLTALILQRPLDLPAQTNLNDVSRPEAAQSEKILPPNPTPDPLEPLNRFIWTVNKGLIIGIVQPTSRVYRFIVRKPLRIGINNFTRNITYPGRLLNNLLQARWIGARDE